MALAADEASYGYGRNVNVDDAMYVLAQAGYNTDNWACLTDGYQVYWYDIDNRMILYNSATGEIEYPEEYIGATTKVNGKDVLITLTDHVHIYNENHIKAQQFNMSLSSSITTSNGKISSTGISGSGDDKTYAISSTTTTVGGISITSATTSSANNLKALASSESQAIIKSSLGVSESALNSTNIYMYATKESISADTSGAYASLQIAAVGTEPTLENSGDVKENLYYLSIVNNNGTSEQLASAKKAAAQYIYNIFDQITEGKIEDNVTVIIAPGTELDCSLGGADWAPCKTFQGYFGTPNGTVTIKNASLTAKTGYAQVVNMSGIPGHDTVYFVTGFMGTIYGNTVVENITFENLNINDPASDASQLITGDSGLKRNTVALIGGITDGAPEQGGVEANVIVRNINIAGGSITGKSCVGGIVGYIGASNKTRILDGKILIQNCNVSANLTSELPLKGSDYGNVSGIVSFVTRTKPGASGTSASTEKDASLKTDLNAEGFKVYTEVTIENCKFTGTLNGNGMKCNYVGYAHQPCVRIISDDALVLGNSNGLIDKTYDAVWAGGAVYTNDEWSASQYNTYND